MKKKVFFVVLGIAMLSVFGYAQTGPESSFELGGTFMHNTSTGYDFSMNGGGINFAGVSYKQDKVVGYGAYANFVYGPYEDIHVLVIDVLFGPAFKIKINERFRLPIALGVYIDYPFVFGSGGAAGGFNIGAGANITAQFSLSKKIHLYGRMQVSYTFLDGGELFLTPSVGIGWNLSDRKNRTRLSTSDVVEEKTDEFYGTNESKSAIITGYDALEDFLKAGMESFLTYFGRYKPEVVTEAETEVICKAQYGKYPVECRFYEEDGQMKISLATELDSKKGPWLAEIEKRVKSKVK